MILIIKTPQIRIAIYLLRTLSQAAYGVDFVSVFCLSQTHGQGSLVKLEWA